MEIHQQIRNKVRDSNWRTNPTKNGCTPSSTFNEIVSDSFEEVKKLGRSATHCKLYDMYNPSLGDIRKAKSYSALQPNGFRDRHLINDLREYSSYKIKQGEWKVAKDKYQPSIGRSWGTPKHIPETVQLPFQPTSRRQYPVPAEKTRFENFSLYWNGRAKGLDFSEPFLHNKDDTYEIEEDRRYQRLYWAPVFISRQPTARHGRQLLLSAY